MNEITYLDGDIKTISRMFIVCLLLLLTSIIVTIDFSDTSASVKVLEVGKRYAFLNIGEQYYIRVQNAYSEEYSSSSESYNTCIKQEDMEIFKKHKDANDVVKLHITGNGISTIFTCLTGDMAQIDFTNQSTIKLGTVKIGLQPNTINETTKKCE